MDSCCGLDSISIKCCVSLSDAQPFAPNACLVGLPLSSSRSKYGHCRIHSCLSLPRRDEEGPKLVNKGGGWPTLLVGLISHPKVESRMPRSLRSKGRREPHCL